VNCIRDLLRYDPDKRLTSRECLEHVYLQETIPRNHITIPPGIQVSTSTSSIPTIPAYANGTHTHSNPSLVSPPHIIPPVYSHSAHNLHQPQQFPDASITHRIPYPIPAPQPQFPQPPNSIVAHNGYRHPNPPPDLHPTKVWSDSQVDYPMDVTSPQDPSHPHPNVRPHVVDVHDSPMVQDPPRAPEPIQSNAHANLVQNGNKPGKLAALSFGKKRGGWGLGMFSGEKSHHNALPPVDETSPAIMFPPSRKRAKSSSTDSRSLREPSPVRECIQDVRDAKKMHNLNKKEAQRLHREAELEKRKLAERNAREQARAVIIKRQQMLRNNVGDDIEWRGGSEQPVENMEPKGKHPSSGPVRRDQHTNGNALGSNTINAAAGKFLPTESLLNPPDRDREWRGPSERISKIRRREFDDDHSMSSSDVHSISRMSSISFATVDSDPGPSRLRNRPSLYGISRRTSRSSLRTSFDDFPPSARSSNSFSLEGQLAHDFRTQASVTSHPSGSVSPPPLQLLSLSPTMSPSLSPSPPWLQVQQHKDERLSRTQSPSYISISPRFHSNASAPHSPLELNGQLPPLPSSPYGHPPSSYGYPPSSGHTPKSAKSAVNPIFKVVSYKWDPTDGLVPDDSIQPPSPPPPLPSPNALPPFSHLEAVAGGEYPPLSPMVFTTPEAA
jgi:hypothetical protein